MSLSCPPSLPGWLWNGQRLVHDDTVDGCASRGAAYLGSCKNTECSRRVKLDFMELSARGYGRTPIHEAQDRYRCYRRPVCDLFWVETYPRGVPLQAYVGDQVELEISCDACRLAKRFRPIQLIERFRSTELGDGNTGIMEAAKRIRGRCRCGAQKWRMGVIRPDPMKRVQAADGNKD